MRESADMVQERELLVEDTMVFTDGNSSPAECTGKCIEQNVYYCRYGCNTMVHNVFTYGSMVKFIVAINFPGN